MDQDDGMEVGLGPGNIVLDGDPSPPNKRHSPSNFWPMSVVAGWIKMPFGTEVCLGPGDIVLDGNPAPPSKRGIAPPPNFRPMSVVAKWLDGSRCHLVL